MRFFLNIKNKIRRNNFLRNILLIASGTAFAQGLSILVTPIVTRIYSPEDFGVLASFNSVMSIVIILGSLDYHRAIPLAKDDEKVINLISLSCLILSMFTIFITLFIIFFGDNLLFLVNLDNLIPYKYFIVCGFSFTVMYNIFFQVSLSNRSYKIITQTTVSQSVFSNLIKIFFGFFKSGPLGLILSSIIGRSFGAFSLTRPLFARKDIFKLINFKSISEVFSRYRNFPMFLMPSNYVYTLGNDLPILIIAGVFGSSVVGLFGFAVTLINIPISLVGMSVSHVFFAEAANLGKSNPVKIKEMSKQLIMKLALIGIVPLITLLFFGPQLFSIVFGKDWYDSGVYAQALSFMVYSHFMILPIGRLLEIFEKQKISLIFNLFRLLFVVVGFYFCYYVSLPPFETIFVYSIINSFFYILLFIIIFKMIDKEISFSHHI